MEIASPTAYLGRKLTDAFGLHPVADNVGPDATVSVEWNHLWLHVRFFGRADLIVAFYDQGDGSMRVYLWINDQGRKFPLGDACQLEYRHLAPTAREGLVKIDDLMDGGLPAMAHPRIPRERLGTYLEELRRARRPALSPPTTRASGLSTIGQAGLGPTNNQQAGVDLGTAQSRGKIGAAL